MTAHILGSLTIAGLTLLATSCPGQLAPYEEFLVGAPSIETGPPEKGEVCITYLGTNGFCIRSADTTLLIDPYFSRVDLRRSILNAPVSPETSLQDFALDRARIPRTINGYLATHGHIDHLFDIPSLQRRFGGIIIGSPTSTHLSSAAGVASRFLRPSLAGQTHRVGSARIQVLSAAHDRFLGQVPYPGQIENPLATAPQRIRDWRVGTPLAFLIQIEGRRIYIESGGTRKQLPTVGDVDLAIMGVAVAESQARYAEAVRILNARYVLPSHQDDFFKPLEAGFRFSSLSNFPGIAETHEKENLPGRLILMDYFHTWKLPPSRR